MALNDILTSESLPTIVVLITAGLGILIGSVTFSGSLVAAGKLQGLKFMRKLTIPAKGVVSVVCIVLMLASFVMLCVMPEQRLLFSILTTVFALIYGLVFVIPIGGADMPVVISVLNACTGTAVAMSGLIEWLQANATATRSGDWADFAANCIGIVLAALLGRYVLPRVAGRRGFFTSTESRP